MGFFAWRGHICSPLLLVIWAFLVLLIVWINIVPHLKSDDFVSFTSTSQKLEYFQTNKSIHQQLSQELSAANYMANTYDLLDAKKALEFGTKLKVTARKKVNCVKKLSPDELLYSNRYWQVLQMKLDYSKWKTTARNLYIYNAFLDIRAKPYVRILLIADGRLDYSSIPSIFCQLWYANDSRVEIVKVEKFQTAWIWTSTASNYYPFLLSCPLHASNKGFPVSVSLAMKKCDKATNNVQITFQKPPIKNEFGVCFKMLHFPATNVARKIIETVELLKMFGVEGVHFSILSVEENTLKVLQHYQSTGYATLKMFSLPGYQPNFPLTGHLYLRHHKDAKRKQELIPYNDCFLSNMYRYRYIALSDIDEILISPHRLYETLLRPYWNNNTLNHSSLCFDMKLFLTKIMYGPKPTDYVEINASKPTDPNFPEIAEHVFFDKHPICNAKRKRNSKCFYRTDQLLVVHNHYEINCLENVKDCHRLQINMEEAYIHHHRQVSQTCHYVPGIHPPDIIQNPFGYDPLIQAFAPELKDKVASVLQNIPGLIL